MGIETPDINNHLCLCVNILLVFENISEMNYHSLFDIKAYNIIRSSWALIFFKEIHGVDVINGKKVNIY